MLYGICRSVQLASIQKELRAFVKLLCAWKDEFKDIHNLQWRDKSTASCS